jgi:hypothetical protein
MAAYYLLGSEYAINAKDTPEWYYSLRSKQSHDRDGPRSKGTDGTIRTSLNYVKRQWWVGKIHVRNK